MVLRMEVIDFVILGMMWASSQGLDRFWKQRDFARKGCRFAHRGLDVKGSKGFFHRCKPFRRDDVGARDEKMGGGADLIAFEGVVPEAMLPALAVDDRELNGGSESLEVLVKGEGLEELLGVCGAVGLDQKHATVQVLESLQCREEFVARPAADTIAV
jgi:hypothetical protein